MSAASTILADLARLLRSHGWRVSPPGKSAAAKSNPCPTCGHRRAPTVRDHILALAQHGEVTRKQLVEVAECSIGTAHNELSWAAQEGKLVCVGRGRYRLPGKAARS